MERKNFQQSVLEAFDIYVEKLKIERERARQAEELRSRLPDPSLISIPDWPKNAWEALRTSGNLPASATLDFSSHEDGIGNWVPNVCLKLPTGGGKTLMAAECAARLSIQLKESNTGLVLWIVPNEAIYSQTIALLRDREHPYRQILDRAAAGAGNVRILEKDSPLNQADLEANLCVMMLMLQSAKRQSTETLRIFRDRGDVHGFIPPPDDAPAHEAMLAECSNLDTIDGMFAEGGIGLATRTVRTSLGNAVKLSQPIIVMDEGHYAYTDLAMKTIYGFNPAFVLELSATPSKDSNILVNVSGAALDEEEMIKLPINVTVKPGKDWRDCLRNAWDKITLLQSEANRLRESTQRYIRPILLVQVERTGKEQRESGLVHSEDAREFLEGLGVSKEAIAVKTSELNELREFSNRELLKDTCPIRVIITKKALQEGWDCPFAYVLCSLAASKSLRDMTQLVGRILRQPETKKTGIEALDECYVFCNDVEAGEVVKAIKNGLEQDGMGDLASRVTLTSATTQTKKRRVLERRTKFAKLRVFLPKVLWNEPGQPPRELDYERDILSGIDWDSLELGDLIVEATEIRPTKSLRFGLEALGEGFAPTVGDKVEAAAFDPAYATRVISNIVPNPWVGRRIIQDVIDGLKSNGKDDAWLALYSGDVLSTLTDRLSKEQERMAEEFFKSCLASGQILFNLKTDGKEWKLPDKFAALLSDDASELRRGDGSAIENSVFQVFEQDFNGLELSSARYIDVRNSVSWWHRNVARGQGYGLQGWRKNRIYPDILVGVRHGESEQYFAIETKGDQLAGNLDTKYKEAVFRALTEASEKEGSKTAGELDIETANLRFSCDIILESNWEAKLSRLLSEEPKTPVTEPLHWVAATDLRNWCEGEPVLDWFEKFGKDKGYEPDHEQPDFRPDCDFSLFIRKQSMLFEAKVIKLLSQQFDVQTVLTPEQHDPSSEAFEQTLELMRAGIDIIAKGVVRHQELALYGIPDLLVRSDVVNRIFEVPALAEAETQESAPAFGSKGWHYVPIDIKFSSFELLKSGEVGKEHLSKKVQVAAYCLAVGEMQGYQPTKGFLLGRCVDEFKLKGQIRSCLGQAAPVTVSTVLVELDEAARWIRLLRKDGHLWDVRQSPLTEMQLNMSNTQDAPWHKSKKELAAELKPLSALWQVTPSRSSDAFSSKIFRWHDMRLKPEVFNFTPNRTETLRAILNAQRPGFKCTAPSDVLIGRDKWGEPQGVEFYVDFETLSDLNDSFEALPTKGGETRIFMIGCGHLEAGHWIFQHFTADNLSMEEEGRILKDWIEHMETVRLKIAPTVERPLVFHWSPAEVSFLQSAYNSAVARHSGNWPLPNWYDLLSEVVRPQPFVVNEALAFGLKAVAKALHSHGLLKTKWEDGPMDGLAAMVAAWNAYGGEHGKEELLAEIGRYNEVDCRVMMEILSYLRYGVT